MIIGIGVDLAEIDRIKAAQESNAEFAAKVLTTKELADFQKLPETGHRRYEYLAGRFSAKESYSKAYGSGLGKVALHDVEILNDPDTGRPIITKHPFDGQALISISHVTNLVMTQVILQK
ncbi:holo-ACP synthase [Agrilactobacillus composti]|uniref:holo-ACP synthase n=1 Tax=Agrilactobacillus composti TaxID=398555 RepID=UPI000704FEB5|nr:holo-ACP synthase [Agrilactobacillus composti]